MTLTPRVRNLWLLPAAATTLGCTHTVWIKPKYSGKQRADLLAHEEVHLRQAQSMGSALFRLRWLLSPTWRMLLEAEAYAESVRRGDSLSGCAESLSSWLYLRCCTFDEAKQAIQNFLVGATT